MRINRDTILASIISLLVLAGLRDASLSPIVPAYNLIQIFLVLLAALVGNSAALISTKDRNGQLVIALVYLYMLYSFILAAFTEDPLLSAQRIIMIFIPTMLVCSISIFHPRPAILLITTTKQLVFIVALISLLGITTYVLGTDTWTLDGRIQRLSLGPLALEQKVMGIPPFLRAGGYFGNPNALAGWIAVTSPFVFALWDTRMIGRLTFLATMALFVAGEAITISRTGISLLIFSSMAYYILSKKVTARRLITIMLVGFLSALALLLYSTTFSDTGRALTGGSSRFDIWNTLISSISENPFFGIGFGLSREVILLPDSIGSAAHNSYLETLSEVGIIGFIMFLGTTLLPILIIYQKQRSAQDSQTNRIWSTSVLVFSMVFMLRGLTEGTLYRFSTTHFIFFFITFLAVNRKFTVHDKSTSQLTSSINYPRVLEPNLSEAKDPAP